MTKILTRCKEGALKDPTIFALLWSPYQISFSAFHCPFSKVDSLNMVLG